VLNSSTKQRNSVPLEKDDDIAEPEALSPESVDDAVEELVRGDTKKAPRVAKERRRVSISVNTLIVGVVIALLVAAASTMTWLYFDAKDQLASQAQQASDYKRAEQIALDYSVNAAIMDYKDLRPWKDNLGKGTSPELKAKMTKAGDAMEQVLTPLQWVSNAKPLTAKVQQVNNGVYVVQAFVGVMTKTVQAPDSLQSTATYNITIDSNHDWQITDVGGIGDMLGDK
jgi:Mce-associated membrane protein